MDTPLDPGPAVPESEFADDVRGMVKAELEPGERLLWAGRPVPKVRQRAHSTVLGMVTIGVLSLVALAAFLGLMLTPPKGDQTAGLLLLGLVSFVVAFILCLGLVAGVYSRRYDRAAEAGTLYALTDRRAIIWIPDRWNDAVSVYSIPRGEVARVHRVEYPGGSGDVVLTLARPASFHHLTPRQFDRVAEVRRVEEQVRRTLVVPGTSAEERSA